MSNIEKVIQQLTVRHVAGILLFLKYDTISRSLLKDVMGDILKTRSCRWRLLNQLKLCQIIEKIGEHRHTKYKLTDLGKFVLKALQSRSDGKMKV